MATLIKLKRKATTGNNGIKLSRGEPFYNIADKHLYIGHENNEDLSTNSRMHIAQVTGLNLNNEPPTGTEYDDVEYFCNGKDTVSFSIGEDMNNSYSKKIERVAEAYTAQNGIKDVMFDKETGVLLIETLGGVEPYKVELPISSSSEKLVWKTF